MNRYCRVAWSLFLLLLTVAMSEVCGDEWDDAIARHRMGELIIKATPGAAVEVDQLKHEFWFGCALSSRMFQPGSQPADADKYKKTFLELFNAAVTENALKWAPMEPRRGEVHYETLDAMLAWTEANEIPLRGHCLFWGVPNRVQDWVKKLDDDQLRATLRRRALTVSGRYRGRFAEYDLNNEMMHANYYAERLGPEISGQMASWVREADPSAKLFVNDYDVLTGNRLDDYIRHVRQLQQVGFAPDGLGVQGHLHGDDFDPKALQDSLDKLAQLNLPIRITEFNFPGQRSRFYRNRWASLTAEQEEAKAKAIVQYYRICFAHPAVHGILMWGFWEGANWIPVSSLYKRDWTPTPAAKAYQELIFERWWTRWKGSANERGECRVPAFYGLYRVRVDGTERLVRHTRSDAKRSRAD